MAKTKTVASIPDDFDPFRWRCRSCGKEREYTQEEIDKLNQPYPDPENHPADFYVSCPFCQKGIMEPPESVFLGGAFKELEGE
jgi:phage terminase large subunit GpA-like protein